MKHQWSRVRRSLSTAASLSGESQNQSYPKVQTVLGPIEAEELGWTLAHEHFFTKTYDAPGMYLSNPVLAHAELEDAMAVGTRSVIDLTTVDIGRDPRKLRALSQATGVNIIMGTGWYVHKTYPDSIAFTSTNGLVEALLTEIECGVDGVFPGVIGEIGIANEMIEAREERVFRAVARVHRTTGLPIFVHQQRTFSGPLALEILLEEGVAPNRVVFCHMDSITDFAVHERAVELGVWLSYDRIQGWDLVFQLRPWEVEHRVELLRRARQDSYLNRILLSTDCCVLGDLRRYGGPGYAYTHGDFAEKLRSVGFTESELNGLFHSNPKSVLTGVTDAGIIPAS